MAHHFHANYLYLLEVLRHGPKFYWERTDEEIELYNEMMRLDEEQDNGTKIHLKSFTFYRLLLVDHPSTKSLLTKIQQVRQDRLKWNHFGLTPMPPTMAQNFNYSKILVYAESEPSLPKLDLR